MFIKPMLTQVILLDSLFLTSHRNLLSLPVMCNITYNQGKALMNTVVQFTIILILF